MARGTMGMLGHIGAALAASAMSMLDTGKGLLSAAVGGDTLTPGGLKGSDTFSTVGRKTLYTLHRRTFGKRRGAIYLRTGRPKWGPGSKLWSRSLGPYFAVRVTGGRLIWAIARTGTTDHSPIGRQP